MLLKIVYTIFFCLVFSWAHSQQNNKYWHGIERTIEYRPAHAHLYPEGGFEILNGKRRFNRALYGTNTGFRVEAGDLPEFALYMPGMGGNFKLGLNTATQSKWFTQFKNINATYADGAMHYLVYDSLKQFWDIHISVYPCADRDGMIVAVGFGELYNSAELIWAFGGATGKKFSRDGDIGADPESSFYMQPEYCKDNVYKIGDSSFNLTYGTEQQRKQISGIVPKVSAMKIVDAAQQETPKLLYASSASSTPAIAGSIKIKANTTYYFLVQSGEVNMANETSLRLQYEKAKDTVEKKSNRIGLQIPDRYLTGLDQALSIAADAIWEHPTYLHGSVAWRMRLPAWRGAYVADPLGWHDRARTHFDSYALSQITTPDSAAVVMDTALHLARHLEKIGTGMFTSGYICRNPNGDIRPHHYDMNLVFIDQLLNHFNYTGDTAYVKKMWPVIERHLAWEKRNFDTDGDGLYDAYCCIWASDGLQYSGGGVTHSSAYNYRAFKVASELAVLIGEDGAAYKQEAEKISRAVNKELWLPQPGRFAEYKDLLGKKLVHPVPGIWTIYHALDSKLPDPFQAYQATRYVDTEIPHIPVKAKGLLDDSLYLLSTSNWQPYTWSVNNVALAENLHMALAYWQANRPDEAFRLFKSAIAESMFLGASPGGFQQLSFYDAIRGQLYRDFADPVGIAARTLVEGLFGIQPDALHDTLFIQPGYPVHWNQAQLRVPDINFTFMRSRQNERYIIRQSFPKRMHLKLNINAARTDVQSVQVNGKNVKWKMLPNSIGHPLLQIAAVKDSNYNVIIRWKGEAPAKIKADSVYVAGDSINLSAGKATVQSIYDPQLIFSSHTITGNRLRAAIQQSPGHKTVFVQLKQGAFTWWEPVNFLVKNTEKTDVANREIKISPNTSFEKIDLTSFYNEKVTNIFKLQYLSPRPTSPTLQLPTQGIGNWCYPLATAEISDSGLRAQAGIKNEITLPQGIPFSTPGDSNKNNIVFTSQWDNFPDSVIIPLSGRSSHAYMLMAGTTNPMQSRLVNGEVHILYTDGSADILPLKNPVNWWPIEQDYINDGYAFTTDGYIPLRYYLKKGIATTSGTDYITIRGFSNRGIDGGAATVLDLPLNAAKELRSIVIHSIANDVVIGLMSLTVVR